MALTLYQWLCLLGIPALLGALYRYVHKQLAHTRSDLDAAKLGIQALLRSQMIADYNRYRDQGFAPIYARENFENCWKQYHSLGANGVMDDLHEKFLNLPTK